LLLQCEYQFRMDGHTAALRHLEQALIMDPSYAPAMALAALCYAQRRDQSWMTDLEGEARDGLRLASRAIELGKDDANVFWMAGYAVYRLQMNAPRGVLNVEPQLTLTKLRARLMFVDEKTWCKYSAALRLAGLSE
jgi:hypothetical protein